MENTANYSYQVSAALNKFQMNHSVYDCNLLPQLYISVKYDFLAGVIMAYKLKKISEKDRTAVIDIFNYFIKNSFAAYPESEVPYQKFDRFLDITAGYPAITVRDESDQVVGFAFLHPYYQDDSLRHTAEISYFILPEHTRRGLGTLILEYFISEAGQMGIRIFLASISSLNDQSIQFHLKHGFVECGRFKGIGKKLGRIFDVVWMQKNL